MRNKLAKCSLISNQNFVRLVGMIALVVVVMSILRPGQFLTLRAFESMAYQFPEYGLMSLGLMLVMISGGIDLSCVGIANLSAILCALTLKGVDPQTGGMGIIITAVFLLGLLVGLFCGTINAFFVHKFHIPPIMTTIGTMALFKGIGLVITDGKAVSGMPVEIASIGTYKLFGMLPLPLVIFIIAVAVVAFVMRKTSFGLSLYLLGESEKSARYAGLNKGLLLLKVYMASGLLSAVAGLVMLVTLNSAKADYGSSYQLLTILICVLGGVNPNGGSGRVGGVVLAVIVMQLIASGMNMFGELSVFYRNLVWGLVLISIMVVNYYLDKKSKA